MLHAATGNKPNLFALTGGHWHGIVAKLLEFVEGGKSSSVYRRIITEIFKKRKKRKSQNVFELGTKQS